VVLVNGTDSDNKFTGHAAFRPPAALMSMVESGAVTTAGVTTIRHTLSAARKIDLFPGKRVVTRV
jgi:hypothetical protein